MLTCQTCKDPFERSGSRGPIPQFCSIRCKGKRDRQRPGRKEYEREYRRSYRASGRDREYAFAYNRRPKVRAKARLRAAWLWATSPEYRARQLARYSDPHAGVVVASPYTGHRWLEMARELVGPPGDGTAPWADDRYDEMGEAVLALLEGRDMKEAVTSFRKKEYISRYRTIRVGDWGADEETQSQWFEKLMPTVPSAEEEAMTNYVIQTRFNDVSTKRRPMKHRTQQPSQRRARNK